MAGRGRQRRGQLLLLLVLQLLLLLRGVLLVFLPPGTATLSVQQAVGQVKLAQISLQSAAALHVSSENVDSLKSQESPESIKLNAKEEEEKTLKELVGLLQNVVKNIPTKQAEAAQPTKAPAIVISPVEPSPSETVDTVWVNLKPKTGGVETTALPETTTTTAFWKLRSDASVSVVLHSETASVEEATLENLRSKSMASALYSDTTVPEKSLASVAFLMEDTTTEKSKSFDQLTNGALASLVESLKNVKRLHMTLHKVSSKLPEEQGNKKLVVVQQHKTAGADILALIDTLIATIKNAPASVKGDPALHEYIEKAESFLKNALELAAEAEKKLTQEQEKRVNPETSPPPPTTLLVSKVIPPSLEPLVTKTKDMQVEMGKLKAFINLLYGFSPHLTSYAQNSASKNVAEDIVERAMAVLDAIKSIFCGNPEGRSKQMLKQLLKEDMELVRQAMNGKRVI